MMTPKSKLTLILIAALVILIGIYFFWQKPFDQNKEDGIENIVQINKLVNTQKIEINMPDKNTVLEKNDGLWVITNQENQPANEELVNALIEALKTGSQGKLISQNPDKQVNFMLTDETASRLKLSDDQGEVITEILIGKLDPAYSNTYVKKTNSDNVLLVEGNLISNLNPADWVKPQPEPDVQTSQETPIE